MIYRPSTAPLLDSCSTPILLLDIQQLRQRSAPIYDNAPLRYYSSTFNNYDNAPLQSTTTLRSDTAPRHSTTTTTLRSNLRQRSAPILLHNIQQLRQRSAPILLHDIFNIYDNAPLRYCSTTPSTSTTTLRSDTTPRHHQHLRLPTTIYIDPTCSSRACPTSGRFWSLTKTAHRQI